MNTTEHNGGMDDGQRVNRLFDAVAVLEGLEALAREDAGDDARTSMVRMSRTARQIIGDVIAGMNP